ncbi:sensor histidine kinase [Flavobacterium olei]|uniref:sensor histidine kinase n=1 Tax=Flavobacterium olei TaxID=1886782 RepID=UPI003219D1A7
MDSNMVCAQENFETAGSHLQRLADFLPYPIILSERIGTVNYYLYFNQNFIDKIGYNLKEAGNAVKLNELLYPDENYRSEVLNLWKSKDTTFRKKRKKNVKIKAQLTLKSGKKKWYQIKDSIINDIHITVFVNINSEVRLQQKLKKNNGNNERMLSILGHDLKSPIANLISISTLGENSEISPQEFTELMQLIKEESTEVLKLLDTTFAWARHNFNTIQLNVTLIDFEVLLEGVLKVYKCIYEKKNIKITCNVKKLVDIKCDTEILTVIVRNLISNAIKFSHQGGLISINATARELVVSDNGIGMTGDMVDGIMDNNYKTTRGTANEKGIGVGLQLVLNLAEKINCRLLISSAISKGTSVKLVF